MFDKEETGWRRGEKRGVVAVFNCPPAAPVRGKACPLTALDLKIWLFGFYAVLWLASVFSSHVSVSGGWQHKRCAEQHKSAVWWLRTTRDEKSQNQFNISNITDGHADFFSMSSGLSLWAVRWQRGWHGDPERSSPKAPPTGQWQTFIQFWLHVSKLHAAKSGVMCQDVVIGPLQGGEVDGNVFPAILLSWSQGAEVLFC